jgi:hypothetical protein
MKGRREGKNDEGGKEGRTEERRRRVEGKGERKLK